MDWIPIASILVSVITAAAAVASGRASAKASVKNAEAAAKATSENTKESSRVEMEKEAYIRARDIDVATIQRQDAEIAEIREANQHLNADVKMVHDENQELRETNQRILEQNHSILEDNRRLRAELDRLRQRFTRVERGMDPNDETPIRQRETDTNPYMMEVDGGGE